MIKLFSIFLMLSLGYGQSFSQTIKVVTYNIRYDNLGDGENRWAIRKDFLANQMKFCEPDVLGIQEGLSHQVNYLDSSLVNYSYVGVGRDDGETKGEYSAIFFNDKRFQLIDNSTFWLSGTPEKPSVGWDAAMERICTYALLKDQQTNGYLYGYSIHTLIILGSLPERIVPI